MGKSSRSSTASCSARSARASRERRRAVLLAEHLPGQRAGQNCRVRKPAAADDEVAGRVQLEQEQLTRFERPERSIRRPPEVDLGQMRRRAEMGEPIAVRHRNDQLDAHLPPLTDEDRPVFGGGKWIQVRAAAFALNWNVIRGRFAAPQDEGACARSQRGRRRRLLSTVETCAVTADGEPRQMPSS